MGILKATFNYQNNDSVIYWYNNDPYFDIQHIINVLELKGQTIKKKYNEFSKDVQYMILHKNEFGGYIIRELINEQTMYRIIYLFILISNINI